MPKLFVLSGRDVGRAFDIEEGYVLGRSPDCQVRLHDRSVSRKHARVEREGDAWFLADLGSRNGLFVAGQRVAQAELVDHEEVSVGELPLRFRADDEDGAATESDHETELPSASPPLEEIAAPEPVLEARPEPEPTPGPPKLRSARPRVSLDDSEDELELELEEDIELDASTEAPAQAPARSQARESRLVGAAARAQAPQGFFSTDLTQRPVWIQGIVYLLVLAMAAGAAYGAYLLVEHLRATS